MLFRSYQTAQQDIFAGGDVLTGPKFAIDAIAQGKQAAISIHRYVQPGQSLTLGRDRLTYHAFDMENVDFDTVKRLSSSEDRQVPGISEARGKTFRDDRLTFTEEQVRKETARCLGCGVCTTRCKFDAIHLRKRTYVESIEYFDRPKVLSEFIAGRRKRIEIRKAAEH